MRKRLEIYMNLLMGCKDCKDVEEVEVNIESDFIESLCTRHCGEEILVVGR